MGYPVRLLPSLWAICVAISSSAQRPFERTHVVEIDTVTSPEVLRGVARKWFADSFKDANSVIQLDDPATNTIIGKGWSPLDANARLQYTIEVQCKKGRVRVRVYDVRHEGVGQIGFGSGAIPAPSWGPLYDEERCYVHQGGAVMEKRMFKACEKNRPIYSSKLAALVQSIENSLRSGKASADSDW